MSSSPPTSSVGSLEMPSYYVQIPTSIESSDTSPTSSSSSSLDSQSSNESPLHSSTTSSTTSSTMTFDSSDMYTQSSRRLGIRIRMEEDYNMVEKDDHDDANQSWTNHYLIPLFGFVLIFSIFCLILWGLSRPIKTHILVKDLTLQDLYIGIGSDHTGVPTTFLTLNTSLKAEVYNPATFFGIHVSAHSLLLYSGIPVATTRLRYYQPRQSRHLICAKMEGNRIPLYGAGGIFARAVRSGRIPLRLQIHIEALGKVFGPLVKTQHRWNISCPLSISSNPKAIIFNRNSCEYT